MAVYIERRRYFVKYFSRSYGLDQPFMDGPEDWDDHEIVGIPED